MVKASVFGFGVAAGVTAFIGFGAIVTMPIHYFFPPPMDATDHPGTKERSGLKLHIDYGTGCQYLVTADGGITPRLEEDGKQMCDY